ncbi:MAG: 50S ribosomal protein L10 [Planctomycetota bacterium]|jgi:large subunit ribosomal protein L10
MSKPVKELIMVDYQKRFAGVDNALLIDIRGIDANENNALRLDLADKAIRVTVIKNRLARRAFAGTGLDPLGPALEGPSALAYGAESVVDVARVLVEWARKVKQLELKAAVLDGELFEGEAGVKRLSTYPTRPEAQARVVHLVLVPAGNIVAAITSPGSLIAGVIKELGEKLEKGEPISKAS